MDVSFDTPHRAEPLSVALVSTYPPTRCGIGRFTHSLRQAWVESAPSTDVKVARILREPAEDTDPAVDLVFDPASPVARRTAARRLSEKHAVILQHEYGIFGPDDGIAVLDLVDRTTAPVITVAHTVRTTPSPRQKLILEHLADRGMVVVLSRVARDQLVAAFDIDPNDVIVIPHGSNWKARPYTPHQRRRLITWGLLGPGKGIERALEAVASLRLDPPVTYDIVGQTHPNVLSRYGQSYRHSLETLVSELGLKDQVRFVDRYVSDSDLEEMVAASDLVVVPYDNSEQVSSGVLTDAVAAGKPVVATAFPHAREFASQGCGMTVGHSARSLATAIERMLTDDVTYEVAALQATRVSKDLSWRVVAESYQRLVERLTTRTVVA